MTAPNAYDYPDIYFDLGINLARLGTVMLDVDPINGIREAIEITGCVPYASATPDEFWIDGAVGERTAHLTLLSGLLGRDTTHTRHVLKDWQPAPIHIEHVEIFQFNGYACVVARATLTPNLLEAHTRLSLLPHIDMFPDYKPHITLAYVQGSPEQINSLVENLGHLAGTTLKPRHINYGT